uniref:Uncharacterized protein n=1 Tax=Arundo donax TaxID=35708 RepID=A0A0A8Z1P5_ARUDO
MVYQFSYIPRFLLRTLKAHYAISVFSI